MKSKRSQPKIKFVGRPPKAPRDVLDEAIRWILDNSDPNVPRRTIEFNAWVSHTPLHRKIYVWMTQMQQSCHQMGRKIDWLTGDIVPLPVHWEQSGTPACGDPSDRSPCLTEFRKAVTCVTCRDLAIRSIADAVMLKVVKERSPEIPADFIDRVASAIVKSS